MFSSMGSINQLRILVVVCAASAARLMSPCEGSRVLSVGGCANPRGEWVRRWWEKRCEEQWERR